jgi:hypothetical protein
MKKLHTLFFAALLSVCFFNTSFSQLAGTKDGTSFPILLPSGSNFDFRVGVDDYPFWTGFDITHDWKGNGKVYIGIHPDRTLNDVFSIVSMDPNTGEYMPRLSLNSDGGAMYKGMVNLVNNRRSTNSSIMFTWDTETPTLNTHFSISSPEQNNLYFSRINANGTTDPIMTFHNAAEGLTYVGIGTATPQATLDVIGDALVNGSMILGGNSTIGGNVSVTGTTTLTRDLISNSAAYFNGGINVTGTAGLQNLQVTGTTTVGEYIKLNNNLSSSYTLKVKTLGDENWGIEHSGMEMDNTGWYGMGLRIMDNGSNGFYIRDKTSNQMRLVIKDGKVGIGKTNPQYALDVNGAINVTDIRVNGNSLMDKMWVPVNAGLSYSNSIGIGTTEPKGKMHVVGDVVLGNDVNNQRFIMHSRTNSSGDFIQLTGDDAQGNWRWNEGITLTRGGNVGIGVTNPTQKLAVEGTILSKEVLVSTSAANWPDYVFEENYELKPLKELENFVNTEKHLPGIPTADEVEAKGIEVGDMVSKLLKKVEELTLYVIEQDKQIQQIKEENDKLKSQIQK